MSNPQATAAEEPQSGDAPPGPRIQDTLAGVHYATVVNHAGLGIAVAHPDGRLRETNAAFQTLLGYDENELHGTHIASLTYPEDRGHDREMIQGLLEGKSTRVAVKKRYLRKDGATIHARVTVSCIRTDQGAAAYLVAMIQDVTDLVEARSRAEVLYASASVGIWDWIDVQGNKEFWTPRFYELLGYEDQEIPATLENFQDALHPDDRERVFAAVKAHFENSQPFDLDYRLRGKSGAYRWFHGLGHAVFGSDGTPTRMVGTIHDIHDARLTEERAERLVLRHALSLRASNIGVWDYDVAANHIVWDEQMYRLYGIRAEDWGSAYEAWLAGVHPDDRAAGDEQIQQALSGEREFNTEFRVVWPTGEIHTIRAIATVVRNAQGEPLRMVGVNWDISEERRRTKELEDANKDLENFAYFASHDLQAPIRHVASFVSLLEKKYADAFDDKGRQWLNYIGEGTAHMKNLVQDLLAYSRVGREKSETEQVAVAELVSRVAERLGASGSPKRLEVTCGALPVVSANPVQLEQVLQNLFENAVRYAKPDTMPQLKVTADETPSHWRIAVEDNGIGIPDEFHKVIFEPFERLTPKDATGSGIGLAICSRIVEAHSGAISVASVPGQGSTFTFTLSKANAGHAPRPSRSAR